MIRYQHPKSLPRSANFKARINGQPVDVLHTDVADFVIAALEPSDFPAAVEITVPFGVTSGTVHPLSRHLRGDLQGQTFTLTLHRPEKISLKFNGQRPFYFFANAPENDPPAENDPNVIRMKPGQISEMPVLELEDNQTLYLPGGSVLKTRIVTRGKKNIRICGHGIFDGSFYSRAEDGIIPSIVLDRCPDVVVEDITMVRPAGWMLLLGVCDGATVRNLKQIGEVVSSDGIDIVGSSNVLVEDCFLHNNDDCVVVKAFEVRERNLTDTYVDGRTNVDNVRVRNCTFANWSAGNAMEIGHELAVDSVRNVIFENIDVLHVHSHGAVFSIHNNDRAHVSDVLFEDIRVEHCYDKFIDFRISRSRYSTDPERGTISNVTLRGVDWLKAPVNEGYTISLIGGYDAQHMISDVLFEDFRINGEPVTSIDTLELHTRHADNIRLKTV